MQEIKNSNNKAQPEIITSASFNNFRGLSSLKIPLSQMTMLTGTNGVGKTSVLEGLYCLFSETKLDVSPLSRYNRSVGFAANPVNNNPVGFTTRQNYNYRLFWKECPYYETVECSVDAQSSANFKRSWKYKKANISDINWQLAANSPIPIDSSAEFALWTWKTQSTNADTSINQTENMVQKVKRAQILSPDGGLYLLPTVSTADSVCRYLDFASLRVQPNKLSFETSKKLTEALNIINNRVTDVRLTDTESGLSVILDDKHEVTLGSIGNGSVTWASALLSIFDAIERNKLNLTDNPMPVLFLIDEIGAGIHYSVMLDMWKYLRDYAKSNPHIQFVMTSHNDDCIRAFCEAFKDDEVSSIVRLYKKANSNDVSQTQYKKEQYPSIISGDWEVRG